MIHCQYILDDTSDLTLSDFLDQRIVKQAVERNLEIIGVAAMSIRSSDDDFYHGFETLRYVIGLRNRLAHGYDDMIDDERLWDVVRVSIPALLADVEHHLSQL